MKPITARVVVRSLGDYRAEFEKKLGEWFSRGKDGYEFRSVLDAGENINAHLIWLFMILKEERPLLRKLTQNGVEAVCQCSVHKSSPVRLEAKALAMAHLMGVAIEIL